MGLRFRQSINLGGGFRVNFSKSGVGYSWGTKGFRATKTATGRSRTTASIPGTGISYVEESGGRKKSASKKNSPTQGKQQPRLSDADNTYDTHEIKNASARALVSDGMEEMLASANKVLLLWSINKVVFFVSLFFGCAVPGVLLLTAASLAFGIYLRKCATIDIDYSFEDELEKEVKERMKPFAKMANCDSLWWISQSSKVRDKKYAAGANNLIKRNPCLANTKAPFPFTTNYPAVTFRLNKEKLVFMPDKLFVIQGRKVGALAYQDIDISVSEQHMIEEERIPKDTEIIKYTWKYVNKSGGPDKRFQDNKKIPVCRYGKLKLHSESGLDTEIIFSNPNILSSE